MTARPPLIDAEHAVFMTSGVSISVGSRDAARLPNLTRAFGCRIPPDRSRVTVFVSAPQSAPVVADISANGHIAVVFTQPSTHRTVQFKGSDACVEALADGDTARVARYRDDFVAHLVALGYPGETIAQMVACPDDELIALSFTPTAAFTQTPGPRAGQPLTAT